MNLDARARSGGQGRLDPGRPREQAGVVVSGADRLYADRQPVRAGARREIEARYEQPGPEAVEARITGTLQAARRLARRARREQQVRRLEYLGDRPPALGDPGLGREIVAPWDPAARLELLERIRGEPFGVDRALVSQRPECLEPQDDRMVPVEVRERRRQLQLLDPDAGPGEPVGAGLEDVPRSWPGLRPGWRAAEADPRGPGRLDPKRAGSSPASTAVTRATSATLRANRPTVSKLSASGLTPARLIVPRLGL